jgi:hypothetical protein
MTAEAPSVGVVIAWVAPGDGWLGAEDGPHPVISVVIENAISTSNMNNDLVLIIFLHVKIG